MKVICINDKNKPFDYEGGWIKEGEIYTVIKEISNKKNPKMIGYVLKEVEPIPFTLYNSFMKNRFRRISDDEILEMALSKQIKKYQETTIKLPGRISRELKELELI